MKYILYTLVLVASFNLFAGYEGKLETITAKHLLDNRDNYVVLDVRSAEEYADGHIDGALNIAHKEVANKLDILKQLDKTIVVHCRSGRRALVAEQALIDAGLTNLKHLEGDFIGWQEQQLPLITTH